jgi:hypothetical protein
MSDKLTKAARNALACCDSVPFDINNLSGPDKVVKAEHLATAESHPMVVKVRELQAAGWTISKSLGRRKVSGGITLKRPSTGIREAETYVWTDGKQSRVWGEEKIEPASLTS